MTHSLALHILRRAFAPGVVVLPALMFAAFGATPVHASWTVSVRGVDVTGIASPIERAGQPYVNCSALAMTLGLQVGGSASAYWIVDSNGSKWNCAEGSSELDSSGRTLPLPAPVFESDGEVYVPVSIIASLADLTLKIDTTAQTASLGVDTSSNATPSADGWTPISIPKSAQELAQLASSEAENSARTAGSLGPDHLAPDHDTVEMNLGVGYVQGADYGVTLAGKGHSDGTTINLNSFTTQGLKGTQIESGAGLLENKESGWQLGFGDLTSEIWGIGQGLRVGLGAGRNRWSSFSLYTPTSIDGKHGTVAAFDDEFCITPQFSVGGEVASDTSSFIKERFTHGALLMYAYQRFLHDSGDSGGSGNGAFAAYKLAPRVALSAAYSHSGSGFNEYKWVNFGAQFPITRTIDMSYARSQSMQSGTTSNNNTVSVSLPIRGMFVTGNYQWGDQNERNIEGFGSSSPDRTLAASFGFPVNNQRARFDYQMSTRWQGDGNSSQWSQLVSTFNLQHSTHLQIISGFPTAVDSDQLRIRLSQDLSPTESLALTYGQIAPYQGISNTPSARGFSLLFNHAFGINTPAGGGTVLGRVVDLAGKPERIAVVRLGSLHEAVKPNGTYIFRHVPEGRYTLEVDDSSLPATVRSQTKPTTVDLKDRQKISFDFRVIPLGVIAGRVHDVTGGKDVGIAGVCIRLGNSATLTAGDGSFSFRNVDPGQHSVVLDETRLASGYTPVGPSSVDLSLKADESAPEVDFQVCYHDRPVVFQ